MTRPPPRSSVTRSVYADSPIFPVSRLSALRRGRIWSDHEVAPLRQPGEPGYRSHVADQTVRPPRDGSGMDGVTELPRVVAPHEDAPRLRIPFRVSKGGEWDPVLRRPAGGRDPGGSVEENVGREVLRTGRFIPARVPLAAARVHAQLEGGLPVVSRVQENRDVVVRSEDLVPIHVGRADGLGMRIPRVDADVEVLLVICEQDPRDDFRRDVVARLSFPEAVDDGGVLPARIGEIAVGLDRSGDTVDLDRSRSVLRRGRGRAHGENEQPSRDSHDTCWYGGASTKVLVDRHCRVPAGIWRVAI